MRREERSFIRLSGGLITSHFATLLQDKDHGFEYTRPETFVRPWQEEDAPPQDKDHFIKQIHEVWEGLLRRFDEKFRDIRAGRMNEEDVRRLWQRPILDALGFEPTSTSKLIIISDQLKYHFSHRGWFPRKEMDAQVPKPPVIHILPPGTDPDARPSHGKPSPHDALQDCLNRHDATWAMLMNDSVIRILRDYHHTTVPGYIEFDLEGIFLNRSFPEFLALYRFCHASRFARNPETGKEPLEDYYEVSRQAGEKIGESLRENVVTAIERLGNGFLDVRLIDRLKGDSEACQAYYQEILTVVYRIIFMLFAEQRGMLGVGGEHGDLFLEEYSITSLRERVDAFEGRDDRHTDLWEGLSVTFDMLEKGVSDLGVNAFDGLLFSRINEKYLKDARCRNTALMDAIRALTWTVPLTEGGKHKKTVYGRQRISYADLSVEEIGAIYESLLDYTPRITDGFETIDGREYRPREFMLDPRGSDRKSTGSYYTNPDLIAELIKSALDPVIAHRISQAGPDPAAREKALLSIRVCDPACGSGAFLIAAANRLGHELAKIRTGTELPAARDVRAARRDILSHCIYGVDLNPMAVELAKVSLWINALVDDKPLSFLDHHIKCGNSLIGTTPPLIAGGIPDDAYTPVEGDSKDVASRIKKANKEQRQSRTFSEFEENAGLADQCAERFAALIECAENNPYAVEKKRREYERLRASAEYERERWAADTWCASFFWPLTKEQAEKIPTTETIRMVRSQGKSALAEDIQNELRTLAENYRFFHWHLEYPEVSRAGGFDCVLGNPPWDMVEANPNEFFCYFDSNFSKLNSKEKQIKIQKLLEDIEIAKQWKAFNKKFNLLQNFFRYSHTFSYQGLGRLNAFKLFLERYYQFTANLRYFGILIPSSIYNDKGCTDLRNLLFFENKIIELFSFENRKKLFPIHSSFKFVILCVKKGETTEKIPAAFMLQDITLLPKIKEECLQIPLKLIKRFSPDTLSVMEFDNQKEIVLIGKIFSNYPLLGENIPNNWNAEFHRDLHHADDHELLQTIPTKIPIYEGKMIHQYNSFYEKPSFWMSDDDAINFYVTRRHYPEFQYFRLAYRGVASSTNETTLITSILPKNTGTLMSLRVIELFSYNSTEKKLDKKINDLQQLYLAGVLNSYILNYLIRRKISANLSTFYIYQLPVPRLNENSWFFNQIVPRSTRLICIKQEFADFWNAVYQSTWNNISINEGGTSQITSWKNLTKTWTSENGIYGWNETKHDIGERAQIRCEIEAIVAHLYGLERSELEYILSTFPSVHEKTPWIIEGILREFDRIKVFLQNLFFTVTNEDLSKAGSFKSIIDSGENERVEFKSSLSWDVQTKQRNKSLEHTIAKIIASFMNTHGGMLFVGVSDAGEILGLDGDIKISKGQNEDGLRLRLDDLVKIYLGNKVLPLIKVHSLKEKEKIYWAVDIQPTYEPVYVSVNGEEEFWVRGVASSRKLSMKETVEYIEKRKKNGAVTSGKKDNPGSEQQTSE